MTEQEAIERIKSGICNEKGTARYCHDNCMYGYDKCAYSMAINALEEIQQYREIGTVKEIKIREAQSRRLSEAYLSEFGILREYQAIGTVEEVMELKEQNIALRNRCKIFTKGQLCIFCPIRCEERAEEYRNAEGSGEE